MYELFFVKYQVKYNVEKIANVPKKTENNLPDSTLQLKKEKKALKKDDKHKN